MIELPLPAKILWPNGRGHHMAVAREKRKHREWAFYATVAEFGPAALEGQASRIQWLVTFYPKTRHAIDDDNARASLKAYQDGIAQALGINDKLFDAPRIQWGEPEKPGKIVVHIGESA